MFAYCCLVNLFGEVMEYTTLEHLAKAKDWLHAFGTGIQTLLAILAFFYISWWSAKKKRKEDQKLEREKYDKEMIGVVLGDEYDKVEATHQDLKNLLSQLKKNFVNGELTELNVLQYMCHPDNRKRFELGPGTSIPSTSIPSTSIPSTSISSTSIPSTSIPSTSFTVVGISSVISKVGKIMKLFVTFRLKLTTMHDKTCPDDIREEFCEEITEMARNIYPFVSRSRQRVIEKVLKYFRQIDPVENRSRISRFLISCCKITCFALFRTWCSPLRYTLLSTGSDIEADRHESERESENESKVLLPYPGNECIKRKVPYVEWFEYENGEMKFKIGCPYSNLVNLEQLVKEKDENIMRREEEIRAEIYDLLGLTGSQDDPLLHLIRLVMLKIEMNEFERDEKLPKFISYVQEIDCALVDSASIVLASERELEDIKTYLRQLRKKHKSVLQDEKTPQFMRNIATELARFIHENTKSSV